MEALIVGLGFGLALILGGQGLARHVDWNEPPISLGIAAVLAAFVVLAGDGAALFGYSSALALIIAAVLAAAGWLRPRKFNLRELAARALRRPRLVGLMVVAALALAAPLLVLPVPLDTDAQGFGYLSLTIREGGMINSLAPWHPEIGYLYSPGALLVFATLSSFFATVPMNAVMMGAAHAVSFFFIWLAWEFGRELGRVVNGLPESTRAERRPKSERWAGAMTLSAALSVGMWTTLMDSHYTAIFALFFSLACVTCLFRFLRTERWPDAALVALTMAGVVITQPDMAMILALGLGTFFVLAGLAVDRPSLKCWLLASLGVPIVAAVFILPWLVSIWPLLSAGIESPFKGLLANWRISTLYHGLIWPALALVGAGIYLRHRQIWVLMMTGWLIAVFEFGTFGLLPRAIPALIAPLLRFSYPFSIAWHGPIISYMTLGASALVWIAERTGPRQIESLASLVMTTTAVFIVLAAIFSNALLALTMGWSGPYGALAASNDVLTMRWLHDHTPPDTRVLNYPGDYEHQRDWEAHWAPVLAERDCVYFRMQPFFLDATGSKSINKAYAEQQAMLSFWHDPSDLANVARLREAGIDYVLVPESVGAPADRAPSWRWQPPALLPDSRSTPKDASYLRLVFSAGGAQVYAVQR